MPAVPSFTMASTIVLTDLDGTLLDQETYSWERARNALDRLRTQHIPCIFVTSKTRAEVEFWRQELNNNDPFIVENGGALIVPRGYFRFAIPNSFERNGALVIEWGTAYNDLVLALKQAAAKSNCSIRGFADMSVAEVARVCSFSEDHAERAKFREYDEPYLVDDSSCVEALRTAIEGQGLLSSVGGRFQHITGANDKGRAVRYLLQLYEQQSGPVVSIGLGDNFNDISFLQGVTHPVLMPSAALDQLRLQIPAAKIAVAPGPEAWSQAVLSLISKPH